MTRETTRAAVLRVLRDADEPQTKPEIVRELPGHSVGDVEDALGLLVSDEQVRRLDDRYAVTPRGETA